MKNKVQKHQCFMDIQKGKQENRPTIKQTKDNYTDKLIKYLLLLELLFSETQQVLGGKALVWCFFQDRKAPEMCLNQTHSYSGAVGKENLQVIGAGICLKERKADSILES